MQCVTLKKMHLVVATIFTAFHSRAHKQTTTKNPLPFFLFSGYPALIYPILLIFFPPLSFSFYIYIYIYIYFFFSFLLPHFELFISTDAEASLAAFRRDFRSLRARLLRGAPFSESENGRDPPVSDSENGGCGPFSDSERARRKGEAVELVRDRIGKLRQKVEKARSECGAELAAGPNLDPAVDME